MEHKPKILIIEDERIVAMDLASSLRALNYDPVDIGTSADEAYELILRHEPDLVLMDIKINGEVDGIEAAEHIKTFSDVPIIYITAYADENTIARAKLTAPYGYLLKPYERRILHTTIEMALYKCKTEKIINDNERWLNTILSNINDALIAVNQDDFVKFLNPVAEILTGFTLFQSIGRSLDDIFSFEESNDLEIIAARRLLNEKVVILNNRSGKKIPVSISTSLIKSSNKDVQGKIIVFKDISYLIESEKQKDELFIQISEAQERLKIVSGKLIEVQETEKRSIARELHDEIGQILTALKINLQTALRYEHTPEMDLHINESIEYADRVLKHVRNLSLDLRPSMLDDLGIAPALRWFIDKNSVASNLNTSINSMIDDKRYPPQIEITCFRIMQEALNNIIKHANARNVIVDLWEHENCLNAKISDDGRGFEFFRAIQTALRGKSVGILGMQERVELIGGSLKIESKEGEGTSVHAMFPINSE